MYIKKGDTVLVQTGKDKGKKGTVVKVFPKEGKAIVDGLNKVKKHQKPRRQGEKGTTVEKHLPMNASNLQLIDPKSGHPTRVGSKFIGDKKVRIAKKSGTEI